MTTILVVVAGVAVAVAAFGFVSWRDRSRSVGDEDRTASHDAEARHQRYEGQRHAAQDHTVHRDQLGNW
ncbi:hypothetical protein [Micromonospora sp. NPDC093277]|uniref:hypothetical protein n=1 Tax=Micromonospora sp. NPDC093277 TaxID=3364291 RepID=UPI00382BB08B